MRHFIIIIAFLAGYIPDIQAVGVEDTLTLPGKVYLRLKNINFVKNNEYFNPVTDGYTLIGYFIEPSLVYSPSKKVNLRLGAHLLNYSGSDKLSRVKLLFSTTYNFSENSFLTLGSLNGADKHRMHDPHFAGERLYNLYSEDGLQIVTENDHLFNDIWISWEHFITKGDTAREIFTSGESFRYTSGKISDIFSIEVPVQLQVKHYGGQLNISNEKAKSYLNLSTGARVNFDLAEKRMGTAGFEYLYFKNIDLNKRGAFGVSCGYALWGRFHYNYKSIYFGSYYWKSHDFFAPNGNPVYSSVSTVLKDLIVPDRKIWTNSFYITSSPINCLEIFFGFDTYYDLNRRHMDTSVALHLNFEKLIWITTLDK